MLELTFGEQVKIILSRKGMTIKELAERIEKQTGKKMSRQNLTQRLGRDNFQEQDMRMIAKILECPFYLDILEEHENHEEKAVKEQKAATPEQKEKVSKAEERDITIGELVDIHKELDAIEKKKSKKRSKKEVVEDPGYVQETIFDFVRERETAEEPKAVEEPEMKEEPVVEPAYEPAEEPVEELAIEIEEEPVKEAVEEEPEYTEEPVYEAEPEYVQEPVYEAEPEYAEEPAYEAEPEYAEEPAYAEEPEYAEEPAYEPAEEPSYTEEPVYEEEPEYVEEPSYGTETEPEYTEEPSYEEPSYEEPKEEPEEEVKPEPKKAEPEKKAHGWRAFFGMRKKHEEEPKAEEEKPEIQYHEFDYTSDGDSGKLAEEFKPEEPEQEETFAAENKETDHENTGYQGQYAQEDEEDLFTSTEEDLSKGELNPYTGHEYESNSVRMHPQRIGYVQVYDRGKHQWTDMTEWAFLGYQERKKALLGKDYEPPIYLD